MIYLCFNRHFYLPAQLVLAEVLPLAAFWTALVVHWSQVSSLLAPGACFHFYHAEGSAFPLLVNFHHEIRGNTSPMKVQVYLVTRFKCFAICRHSTDYLERLLSPAMTPCFHV